MILGTEWCITSVDGRGPRTNPRIVHRTICTQEPPGKPVVLLRNLAEFSEADMRVFVATMAPLAQLCPTCLPERQET